ncbi:hypothetical protein C8R45DRAFT_984541 [Mycena sanguinolenta]|nr:hypothetical protein C8R45DRAFT_984541 [Mycena sanguinolenta]
MVRSGTSRPIELSPTRISRLLRPLRAKCIALATVHPTPSTYGSKTCPADSHPLDVLPPPDTVRSYHVEHRSVTSLRVALYAVRDCFREIIVKTKPMAFGVRRIPRLADLCSTVVGESMEGDEDCSPDAEEDSEQLSEMENIYEAIPVQYRRSALLAHSLDIILHFPHHFTLLSILLDVTLQQEIYHESCIILHWLLRVTLSPASDANSTPLLCHTAHSNYLIDLGRKWVEATLPMIVFVRILTTNLIDAPPLTQSELWTCHALTRFTRKLSTQGFESLLDMASSIVSSLPTAEPAERSQRKHRTRGTEEFSLTEQLSKWLNYTSSFPPFQNSIHEFLDQCYRSGVHRSPSKLAATIVCWATHYLAMATPIANSHSFLHRLLKDVSPIVTIYNLLVEHIFSVKQTTIVKLQESRAILQVYADGLRANNLLLLEASLWACALRFVETDLDGLGNEVSLYREELITAVDDAERRCFQAPQSEWQWEESLGCWTQCDQPPAKKAKHHHEIPRSSKRRGCIATESLSASCPLADVKNKVVAGKNRLAYASAHALSFTSLVSHAHRTKPHTQRRSIHRPLLPTPTKIYTPDETTPTSDDALDLFAYTGGFRQRLLSPPTKIYTSDDTAPTSDDALNLFAYTEI